MSMLMRKLRTFLLIMTALVILIYLFWPNFVNLQKLLHQSKVLRDEVHRLEQENLKLQEDIYNLKHDPFYLEKTAREELGMSREDEVIYKFE